MDGNEMLPCPTCWLPADVLPAGPYDTFAHARCPKGHDNALIPAVLAHLRSLEARDFPQSA